MTAQPLLTISAFARAVDLAPSTLRYYDEAGLLPPAEVDPHTGYRYYTRDLERRAALIRRMRDIGLSVESMRLVLAGSSDEAARILRSYVDDAQRTAHHARAVVDEVLAALASEDPTTPVVVTVDGAETASALRRVARAMSPEDGPLHGVLLDLSDGSLAVVATDRYWLASWAVPIGEASVPERRVFVPAGDVERLARHLERREVATASLHADRLVVGDGGDGMELATAADRFPAYRLVLPGPGVGRAVADRHRLAELLDADAVDPVRLAVKDDAIEVARYGETTPVRQPAVTDGSATLWFSPSLLHRALDVLVGDSVALSWTAPDRAVRLSPVEQRRLEVLLMPVRPPT